MFYKNDIQNNYQFQTFTIDIKTNEKLSFQMNEQEAKLYLTVNNLKLHTHILSFINVSNYLIYI